MLAAAALAALAAGAAACAGSSATSTRHRTHTAPAQVSPAESVMGTLLAPPDRSFLARVRAGKMGGVLLLGNGWTSRSTVATVTAELQRAACTRGEPLLVGADQEGGIVRRLPWVAPTVAPSQMTSPAEAHSQAAAAAKGLRAVGVDVDFAPVVDTPTSNANFLGSRAFSHSASWNVRMARAFVQGLQSNGIAATAKHFPGLGAAGANTDLSRVVIHASAATLRSGLKPFQAAVRAGVKLVMVSTAIYPALDPSRQPAAFSKTLIGGILRQQLGFEGVTVTDSLTVPAAASVYHAATKAVAAGSDLLLFGDEAASERAYTTLGSDAAKYPRLRAQLAQAATRIEALKAWLAARGGPSCPG